MQDKSFLQAIDDLQDRISSDFQESVNHMLAHRTTAADATSDIKDEKVRAAVTSALISGQITSLLALMRDMRILDAAQYDEFATYLRQALAAQYGGFTLLNDLQ